mmetsp:Transcript_74351/g.234841  ORF Transcript_74351/g.234841 Transcript_74351/m.234841 type:complete len:315 (-) Transcript_74351:968-1912(-)
MDVTLLAPKLRPRVGAAEAKGVDAREDGDRGVRAGLDRHAHWETIQTEVLVQLAEVAVRRDGVVHQHEDGPHGSDGSCPQFQMAYLRLGCPQHQRVFPGVGVVDHPRGSHLDGVPQRGPGAVALAEDDVVGREAALLQRGLDAGCLGRTAWRRDTGTSAVLVHGARGEAAELERLLHLRLLPQGRLGALLPPVLQEHTRNALPTAVTVGGVVEGVAAPARRNHSARAHCYVGPDVQHHAHACGGTCACAVKGYVLVQRAYAHQSGRACGVHDGNTTREAQEVGQPVGGGVALAGLEVAGVAEVEAHPLAKQLVT